jgi:NTP pyrophosphatase (non-canonical NTP hydrolase)
MTDLDVFVEKLRKFSEERGWNPYHLPKDLLIKLMEEVGEVAEQFEWQTNEEILASLKDDRRKQAIGDELADVLIVLLTLMDAVDLDIEMAFNRKVKKNALKYPVGQDPRSVKNIRN